METRCRELAGLIVVMVALAGTFCQRSHADSWTVAAIATDPSLPDNITFWFDGEYLYLNNTHIHQPGGSSANSRILYLCGTWGACGIVNRGDLAPDPFAELRILGYDVPPYEVRPGEDYADVWTAVAQLHWLPGTPPGHTASLLLGYRFVGDGAETYSYTNPDGQQSTATGTLVLDMWYYWAVPGNNDRHYYYPQSHAFAATYVPEPSTIAAVLCGIAGIARRRKG